MSACGGSNNATLPGNGHGSANGAEVLWTQSAFLSTYAPAPTSPPSPTTATGPNQSVPSPDSPGSAPVSTQPPAVAEPVLANDTLPSEGAAANSVSEGDLTASPRTDPVDESTRSNPPWIVLVLAAIAIVIAVGVAIGIRSRTHR